MLSLASLLAFTGVAVAMVMTPGPNMAYLVSRSIAQGPAAGLVSLVGVATGLVSYMLLAAFGITAVLLAVPLAYDAIRFAGAAYLAWMAWNAFRPGGRSPFQVRRLSVDSPRKLYLMGLLTSLLNPKIAALYLSLLPQFIDKTHGSILAQTLELGAVQIVCSVVGNSIWIVTAGSVTRFLARRPFWAKAQRWLMGTVLGLLALRMATDAGR
jgi:threonine/homoserine/homoserine lactone efflux protein